MAMQQFIERARQVTTLAKQVSLLVVPCILPFITTERGHRHSLFKIIPKAAEADYKF